MPPSARMPIISSSSAEMPIKLPARQAGIVTAAHGCPMPVTAVFDLNQTRSEEHTSELQSLMRFSYAVICLNKKRVWDGHTRPAGMDHRVHVRMRFLK